MGVIFRHFDGRGDGQISYNEFCDVIVDEDVTQEMLKTKPALKPGACDEAYAARAETAAVRKAVREIGDAVYQKHNFTFKLFKEFERMTHEGVVSNVQIQQGMLHCGVKFKLEDIDRAILYLYPGGDLKKVDYIHF